MEDSVHEALAFNEELEQDQSAGRKTTLNALFAAALAGLWFGLSQFGEGMPLWLSLGVIIACVGVGLWVGAKSVTYVQAIDKILLTSRSRTGNTISDFF